MDCQLDQVLQSLTIIEEDDAPLVIPDQPLFSATERNKISVLGRFLNPDYQRMNKWILDMPRIWRLYDRVQEVALSKDRFQFIFKYEEDLNEVLKTGVWTQDDWGVVMEKWVEDPPPDYLNFLPIWVRIRNIPVNHYTRPTISFIASYVGKVIDFPFDEKESQSQDYVRVRVLFDVSKRLRNSKEIQLPNGSMVQIGFDYERIRKRCFSCQRLTHDKVNCPFMPAPLLGSVPDTSLEPASVAVKGLNLVPPPLASFAEASSPSKVLSDTITARMVSPSTPLDIHSLNPTSGTPFFESSSNFSLGSLEATSSSTLPKALKTYKRPRSCSQSSNDRKSKNLKLLVGALENIAGSQKKVIFRIKGKVLYLLKQKAQIRWFQVNHRWINEYNELELSRVEESLDNSTP